MLGEAYTVNGVEAESPPGLLIALIVYVPIATFATVNVALSIPFEIEQMEAVTALPDNEQYVSLVRNPVPDT